MTTTNRRTLAGLAIAVLVAVVGALGQMATQTDLGRVEVKEITFVNQSGFITNAKAYVPDSATPDSPAHAIVVTHGGNDDKELMSRYALELARRGYVAVAIDMYGHGGSSWLPNSQWLTAGRGVYDMVRNVVTWPNVDPESISLLGYSRGGVASGEALKLDNEELGVIKNVFLIYTDPTYYDADAKFVDVYGARNVSVMADLYDEFFFTMKGEVGGTYSNDRNRFIQILSSPVEYIGTPIAQSFLHFGVDPEGLETREQGVVYEQTFPDGGIGTREITTIDGDHMGGHYDPRLIAATMGFFDRLQPTAVGAGIALAVWYDIFSFLTMAGLTAFLVYAAAALATHTRLFRSVKMDPPRIAEVTDRRTLIWVWGAVAASVVFNVIVVWSLNTFGFAAWFDTVYRANKFVYIPLLSVLFSIFLLAAAVVSYRRRMASGSADVSQLSRIVPGWRVIGWTFLCAFVVVFGLHLLSNLFHFLFTTNSKWLIWTYQPIMSERLVFALLVFPMLGLFYVAASISNDALGYTTAFGRNRLVNALVTSLINALPMIAVMVYFYGTFRITGWNPMFGGNSAAGTIIYPLALIVFVMVFVSRLIYEKTGNPYLGGLIAGMVTSIFTATVSEVRIPEADAPFSMNVWMILIIVAAYAVFAATLVYFKRIASARPTDSERDAVSV